MMDKHTIPTARSFGARAMSADGDSVVLVWIGQSLHVMRPEEAQQLAQVVRAASLESIDETKPGRAPQQPVAQPSGALADIPIIGRDSVGDWLSTEDMSARRGIPAGQLRYMTSRALDKAKMDPDFVAGRPFDIGGGMLAFKPPGGRWWRYKETNGVTEAQKPSASDNIPPTATRELREHELRLWVRRAGGSVITPEVVDQLGLHGMGYLVDKIVKIRKLKAAGAAHAWGEEDVVVLWRRRQEEMAAAEHARR